jgi:type II secretory pathway pseudopilin PulG
MDNPLLRLLSPQPMQYQQGSGAMPVMQQPQMQPQQMAPNKGMNFMRDLVAGALLSYGGAGVAPVLAGQQQRRKREEDMLAQQAEQQRQNQTAAYFRDKDPELAKAIELGVIDGRSAMSIWQQKQQGMEPPTPYTDIAKAKRDLDAGYITPEQYQQMVSGQGQGTDYSERAQAAQQFGLSPDDPGYQSFILTGKMPREDQAPLTATDKKAILEADEMVAANEAALQALTAAEKLSGTANSGMLAGTRAWAGNALPDLLVPDFVSSPQSSQATAEMDNVIMNQALSSMKAIFGGNPTEGERAILLELQAASSMPKPVREQVLRRAKEAATRRLEFNRQRASSLRGGDYYKTGAGGVPGAPVANGWTIEQVD